MMNNSKDHECPYTKLARLAQDRARRVDESLTLTRDIDVLEKQLSAKRLALQESVNVKCGIESKMKSTSQELA